MNHADHIIQSALALLHTWERGDSEDLDSKLADLKSALEKVGINTEAEFDAIEGN